jgi:hypothetical protein
MFEPMLPPLIISRRAASRIASIAPLGRFLSIRGVVAAAGLSDITGERSAWQARLTPPFVPQALDCCQQVPQSTRQPTVRPLAISWCS